MPYKAKTTKANAKQTVSLCASIEETEASLKALANNAQLKAQIRGGGVNVEYLDLGPEHKEWVRNRLLKRIKFLKGEIERLQS